MALHTFKTPHHAHTTDKPRLVWPRVTGPTADEIRLLAYRKWVAAGSPLGHAVKFWVEAERDLNGGRRPRH